MRTVDICINTSQLSCIDLQALPGVIKKCIPTHYLFKKDLFMSLGKSLALSKQSKTIMNNVYLHIHTATIKKTGMVFK